jgi:hypothetical protein
MTRSPAATLVRRFKARKGMAHIPKIPNKAKKFPNHPLFCKKSAFTIPLVPNKLYSRPISTYA